MDRRRERVVGIADMAVSDVPGETLVTYSLGSCVGLSLYDPVARLGGLLHSMLPVCSLDRTKAASRPEMFTDSGVSLLLQTLFDLGATRADLVAVVAGCSQTMDSDHLFRIGERNHTVLRKLLWKNGILIAAEEVGGNVSRTMRLEMATGRTLITAEGLTHMFGATKEG